MKKIYRFWRTVALDVLGVMFMIAALLTGWLPGPGGIPLFIVGLSLLAINHHWARRYIDLLRDYADRLGDLVFVKDRRVQLAYDILGPLLLSLSGWLLWRQSAIWMVSLGISAGFGGVLVLMGNRDRWNRLKTNFKRKR